MNGILNVYKEKGFTSFDVVAKLRGICRQKKIGHTGTLDPDAEGVLPVCLGTSTKVCGMLTDLDKEYEAVLLLGTETDTQDIGGTVLHTTDVPCSEDEILNIIQEFIGVYDQIPPMYSALKVNGRRLYELARAGVEVERKARTVQIYDITIQWVRLPRVKFRVRCSKGTYIRALCHDIGQKAGCGGCMEGLRRTRVGIFDLDGASTLAQIQAQAAEGHLQELLLPVDRLFFDLPQVRVEDGYEKLLKNGNRLPAHAFCPENGVTLPASADLRVYAGQEFFAIYTPDGVRGDYKPLKIFGQGK